MSVGPRSLTELVASADRTTTVVEFVSSDGRLVTTTGELADRSRRVASGLLALGVEAGDRITVQISNRAEAVVLQLAALRVGAVLTPVVPVFGPRELSLVLDDAKPRVLVTERRWNKFDYLAQLGEIDPNLLPEHVVVVGGGSDDHVDWAQLEQAEPLEHAVEVDEAAPCLVIFTSGSSGAPKGVQHSRATLWAEVVDFDYRPHADSSRDVYLQGSAAGHIGGYMFTLRALHYDMRTIVLDGWDAAAACRIVGDEKVTAMVATPFHVVQMLEIAEQQSLDLSSLDMMMAGGAPVSAALVRRADRLGVGLVRAYGMSEHPTFAIGRWSDPLDVRAEHDGYITGANEVRLVDDDGKPVAGVPGEIQVRGPEQFLGYTNAPDVFTDDGWFATGDIGVLEGDLL
ncbi:MAG: AMP-binding protein, partial [Aeromicrobium sp.]